MRSFISALLVFSGLGCGSHAPAVDNTALTSTMKTAPNLFDQLLSDVAAATDPAARQTKVDAFLAAVPESPYVTGTTVVFLSIGAAALSSDLNAWSSAKKAVMTQVADTTLWYRTFTSVATDARCDYKLIKDGEWLTDPRNPHQSPGIDGNNSELRMPKYVPSPALDAHDDIAHGYISDLTADVPTTDKHQLFVYFPPGHFGGAGPYDLLVVNDGADYKDKGLLPNVLDNLIAAGTIRPAVVIFVVPNDRGSEYFGDCSGSCPGAIGRYLSYLVNDLIPFAEQDWKVSSDPLRHAIMGSSYGASVALRAAHEYPGVFGLVGAQSARVDKTPNGEFPALADDYVKAVLPVSLYLDVGTINDLQSDDAAFDKALVRAGYIKRSFAAYHDGHAWGNWRNRLAALLTYLFPR